MIDYNVPKIDSQPLSFLDIYPSGKIHNDLIISLEDVGDQRIPQSDSHVWLFPFKKGILKSLVYLCTKNQND